MRLLKIHRQKIFIFVIFLKLMERSVPTEPSGISYEWETEPDRESFNRIMVESFVHCYKDIPKNVLKVDSELREWLSKHFSDSFLDELKKNGHICRLITAKADRMPAGYALFDISQSPKLIYISELAVDPSFQRRGIGKGLVFSILKFFPEAEKIVLITRKANTQARFFYPSIGFQPSNYIHDGYDPELYTGFEYINLR